MLFDLTAEERDILEALVVREMADLGPEIHHARVIDYREGLKAQKRALERLLSRLRPGAPITPHGTIDTWQPGVGVAAESGHLGT